MKLIFLDIDGVLNSKQFFENKSKREIMDEPLDQFNIQQLKAIVDATDAKLVLSSSWRGGWEKNPLSCSLQGQLLNKHLGKAGLSIFDKTPVLSSGRARDIREYLIQCDDVSHYVILDDNDSDWRQYHLHHNVVKTDFQDGGLKKEHGKKAISILNRKREPFW